MGQVHLWRYMDPSPLFSLFFLSPLFFPFSLLLFCGNCNDDGVTEAIDDDDGSQVVRPLVKRISGKMITKYKKPHTNRNGILKSTPNMSAARNFFQYGVPSGSEIAGTIAIATAQYAISTYASLRRIFAITRWEIKGARNQIIAFHN